jgi:hypothetical protein
MAYSKALYLYRATQRPTIPKWDSNQRFQCPIGPRLWSHYDRLVMTGWECDWVTWYCSLKCASESKSNDKWVWSTGGMMTGRGEPRCSDENLPTTTPTRAVLVLNQCLIGETTAPNRLNYGTTKQAYLLSSTTSSKFICPTTIRPNTEGIRSCSRTSWMQDYSTSGSPSLHRNTRTNKPLYVPQADSKLWLKRNLRLTPHGQWFRD